MFYNYKNLKFQLSVFNKAISRENGRCFFFPLDFKPEPLANHVTLLYSDLTLNWARKSKVDVRRNIPKSGCWVLGSQILPTLDWELLIVVAKSDSTKQSRGCITKGGKETLLFNVVHGCIRRFSCMCAACFESI